MKLRSWKDESLDDVMDEEAQLQLSIHHKTLRSEKAYLHREKSRRESIQEVRERYKHLIKKKEQS